MDELASRLRARLRVALAERDAARDAAAFEACDAKPQERDFVEREREFDIDYGALHAHLERLLKLVDVTSYEPRTQVEGRVTSVYNADTWSLGVMLTETLRSANGDASIPLAVDSAAIDWPIWAVPDMTVPVDSKVPLAIRAYNTWPIENHHECATFTPDHTGGVLGRGSFGTVAGWGYNMDLDTTAALAVKQFSSKPWFDEEVAHIDRINDVLHDARAKWHMPPLIVPCMYCKDAWSVLMPKASSYATSDELYVYRDPDERRRVLRVVVEMFGVLDAAGIFQFDWKPANLLFIPIFGGKDLVFIGDVGSIRWIDASEPETYFTDHATVASTYISPYCVSRRTKFRNTGKNADTWIRGRKSARAHSQWLLGLLGAFFIEGSSRAVSVDSRFYRHHMIEIGRPGTTYIEEYYYDGTSARDLADKGIALSAELIDARPDANDSDKKVLEFVKRCLSAKSIPWTLECEPKFTMHEIADALA